MGPYIQSEPKCVQFALTIYKSQCTAGFEIFGAHRCGASTSAVRTGAHQEKNYSSRTAPHRHRTKKIGAPRRTDSIFWCHFLKLILSCLNVI